MQGAQLPSHSTSPSRFSRCCNTGHNSAQFILPTATKSTRRCTAHAKLACTLGASSINVLSDRLGSSQQGGTGTLSGRSHALQAKPLLRQKRRHQRHIRAAATVGHQAGAAENSHLTRLKAGMPAEPACDRAFIACGHGYHMTLLCVPLCKALQHWLAITKPPKVLWRTTAALVLGGQVVIRILQGKPPSSLQHDGRRRCWHAVLWPGLTNAQMFMERPLL